jgi:hypothetical protein
MPAPAPAQPKTSRGGGNKEPMAHLIDPDQQFEGGKALCGETIKNIPAPRSAQMCTMCKVIYDERRGRVDF